MLEEDPAEEHTAPPPTAVQLAKYAKLLSKGTSPGPDGLPNELLIYAPPEFYEALEPLVLVSLIIVVLHTSPSRT